MSRNCRHVKLKTKCYQTFVEDFYAKATNKKELDLIPSPEAIDRLVSGGAFPVNRVIYGEGFPMAELIDPKTDNVFALVFEDQTETV